MKGLKGFLSPARAGFFSKKMKFKEIEKKWQEKWEKQNLYEVKDSGKKETDFAKGYVESRKKYVLVEFPYPSGYGLHVGHAFTFMGGDVYARFKRMQGYKVLFPMGWDAFGLPTENYAIKMKKKPQNVTKENTDMFKKQMKELAFSFDWSREVNTTDPGYYKWTQWIFIKLFEKGLAYKKEMPINWCPSCKIGLANEEVVDGKCERCGCAEVSRRNINQWVVKITDYADRLIEGLKKTDFIEKVKTAQINWIGKKDWIDISYPVDGIGEEIVVSTTRPDTNFGATFVVLAPEHPFVSVILSGAKDPNGIVKKCRDSSPPAGDQNDGEILSQSDKKIEEIREYVKNSKKRSELDRISEGKAKTGVFTGFYAVNQLNGKKMPIWITDFVLMTVGTGAVVGVPGHDIRDFEFAKQFGLPIVRVVVGEDGDESGIEKKEQVQEKEGRMINSEFLDGMDIHEATKKIMNYLEKKGWGKKITRYHLRDWIFSRQHYWGEPIPMINCKKCGWVTVPEDQLPIELPEVEAYEPTDTGESPLAKMTDWVKTTCCKCGGFASRETDTMPNWAGSDWYFLRYIDSKNDTELASMDKLRKWGPVDVYIGGDEHNVLHLLYSRFIYQFLHDIGVVPKEYPEPYIKRISHGVILGPDNQRMSKSIGNVIVPETVVDEWGVDVLRCYLMFMGPYDGTMAWNEKTLMGVKRFLDKFEKFIKKNVNSKFKISNSKQIQNSNNKIQKEIKVIVNKTIKGVTGDIERFYYNTAIAKMMEMLNGMNVILSPSNTQDRLCEGDSSPPAGDQNDGAVDMDDLRKMIKLLAPFAPYMAEELWEKLGNKESVHLSHWPKADEKYLVEDEISIPIAVNGKRRGEIKVESGRIGDKSEIIKIAREDESVKKWLKGKKITREVYVEGRMVNFVVKD